MNVLSLFDGMSCGRIAIDRIGLPLTKYYASEINEHAIRVAQANYPDTIQLGSIYDVKGAGLPRIDLLIGGSPCQSLSENGSRTGFEGASSIFWQFVRVLQETNPTYFLLENVKMRHLWRDVITGALGVLPIAIDSKLVSAQNRSRLYWTNIPDVGLPLDKGIKLCDILEDLPFDQRIYTTKYNGDVPIASDSEKFRTLRVECSWKGRAIHNNAGCVRQLSPKECERLQTVPDGYTDHVSNAQRYRILGNGWTVDVIAHILSNIPSFPNCF